MTPHSHHTEQLECTHDPKHPDHLLCIEKSKREARKHVGHHIVAVAKKRYDAYYHPSRPGFLIHRGIDSVLGVAVVILLTIIVVLQFSGPFLFSKIALTVSGPHEVVSGETASYSLEIKNLSGKKIKDPVLILFKNNHIKLIEPLAIQETQFESRISLGADLEKGEKRIFLISIMPLGEFGQEKSFSATLQGTTDDDQFFQSDRVTMQYVATSSALTLESTFPDHLIPGNPFDGTIRIVNASSQVATDIRIILDIPNSLELNADHALDKDIIIKSIDPHAWVDIPLKGVLRHIDGSELKLTVKLFRIVEKKKLLQHTSEIVLPTQKPSLTLKLVPIQKTSSLQPGARTSFEIQWNNTSQDTLRDVQIGIRASGFGLTKDSLSSLLAIHTSPQELLWTKNQISELSSISSGKNGKVVFEMTPSLEHDIGIASPDADFEMILTPFTKYSLGSSRFSIPGIPLSLPVDTIITTRAAVRYYTPEGDQLGRGPLPPIAGKATILYGFLDVASSIHPLENAILTAHISSDFNSIKSLPFQEGTYSFDQKSGILTWRIGTLGAQNSHPDRQTGLALELHYTPLRTPTADTILIDAIHLQGIDTITQNSLLYTAPDIPLRNVLKK